MSIQSSFSIITTQHHHISQTLPQSQFQLINTLTVQVANTSLEETFDMLLRNKTRLQQQEALEKIIQHGMHEDELLGDIITYAWDKIVSHSLWDTKYLGLEELEKLVHYDILNGIISKHKRVNRRRLQYLKIIVANWNMPATGIFTNAIWPAHKGRDFLWRLSQLSGMIKHSLAVEELGKILDAESVKPPHPAWTCIVGPATIVKLMDKLGRNIKPTLTPGLSCGKGKEGQQLSTVKVEDSSDSGSGDSRPFDRDELEGRHNRGKLDSREDRQLDPKRPLQCGCGRKCGPILTKIPPKGIVADLDDAERVHLLETSHALGWARFCQPHLRRLASGWLGMRNNKKNVILLRRLNMAFKYRSDLDLFRAKQQKYFRQGSRPKGIVDRLGLFKYTPHPPQQFIFNPEQVFRRFSKQPDAWDTFQRDGTVNIDRVFDYLLKDPGIAKIIDEEFNMYLFHVRDEQDGSVARHGWLRHMFYAIIQQAIRVDPYYYALMAAARPDEKTELISYPYYAKYQVKGETTGFAHFDINVAKYVENGRGGNIIQGSLSLDDEDENGCTLLVPGFNHYIHEWWAGVQAQNKDRSGRTTNAKNIYSKDDAARFGKMVPAPCKAGAVRISKPTIIHGSTPHARGIRRTLFPWFCGIREDHSTLDLPESETWAQVASCHQSMEAPMKSTSGEGFRYGRPAFPFPGVTRLCSTSMIGDALIGGRRWDDPRVREQRAILLGDDDEAALALADGIRSKIKAEIPASWPYVRKAEKDAYRERSFFIPHNRQHQPIADRDLSPYPSDDSDRSDEDSSNEGRSATEPPHAEDLESDEDVDMEGGQAGDEEALQDEEDKDMEIDQGGETRDEK